MRRAEPALAVAQRVLGSPEMAGLELYSFRAAAVNDRLYIRLDKARSLWPGWAAAHASSLVIVANHAHMQSASSAIIKMNQHIRTYTVLCNILFTDVYDMHCSGHCHNVCTCIKCAVM